MSTESLDFVRTTLARAQGCLLAVKEWLPKSDTATAVEHDCGESVRVLDSTKERIHDLETALNRMICAHENMLADSDGRFPRPDMGCPDCTSGTVPDALNTGRCCYHESKVLLGQL